MFASWAGCFHTALVALAIGVLPTGDATGGQPPGATGNVSGRVLDGQVGDPLPGAVIRVEDTRRQTVSDSAGRFYLARLPAGERTLVVEYLGRLTVRTPVNILAGQTVTYDVELVDELVVEESVIVRASSIDDAAAGALNQQKTAPNITNVVSADQLGRLPDANAAEATQRIPGVAIERDKGEGRYVMIRGTAPRLSSIMINGERIPSPENDVRQVALDAIPVDLLEAIQVSKALTADMDADAIGGAVNLVTQTTPARAYALATLGGGYNDSQRDWAQGLFSVSGGRRFDNGRLGLVAGASYSAVNRGSENIEPRYRGGALAELQVRDYTIDRKRAGFNGALEYQFRPNHGAFVRAMFSQLSDDELRRRVRYDIDDTNIDRDLADRVETLTISNVQFGARHLFAGGLHLEYRASASYAEEHEPDRHDTRFRQQGVQFAPNVSQASIDPENIQANPLNEDIGRFVLLDQAVEDNLAIDRDVVGAFDLRIPLVLRRDVAGILKTGLKYRAKRKTGDDNLLVFHPTQRLLLRDRIDSAFHVGSILGGRYVPGEHVDVAAARRLRSRFPFESTVDQEENLADYDATERTTAVYVMTDLALGPNMTLLPGVRVESTVLDYGGFELRSDDDVEVASLSRVSDSGRYTKVFPGVHWRYAFTPALSLRAAATRSMARPDYAELVPFQLILVQDKEIQRGNSSLRPTTSWNYDLMLEFYFSTVGVVSGGVFSKHLTDYIFPFVSRESFQGNVFEVVQPRNGSGASVGGIELAFQNRLGVLPAPFDRIGINANYTFTGSRATLPGREDQRSRLPGQARHAGNIAISYEKAGFLAQAVLNFRDAVGFEVGRTSAQDVFLDSHHQVDVSVGQSLSENIRLFLDILNLTDQPLRVYEGTEDRPIQVEFYSWWATLGLRVGF